MTTNRFGQDEARRSSDERTTRRDAASTAPDPVRRGYSRPRLRALGCASELLEVLGPAQANYGI
jgi:hypothetical protein